MTGRNSRSASKYWRHTMTEYACAKNTCHNLQTTDGECEKCGSEVFPTSDGSWPCTRCKEIGNNFGGMCEECIVETASEEELEEMGVEPDEHSSENR
jgi:hypothetical protein